MVLPLMHTLDKMKIGSNLAGRIAPEVGTIEQVLPDYGKPWYQVPHLVKLNLPLLMPILCVTSWDTI